MKKKYISLLIIAVVLIVGAHMEIMEKRQNVVILNEKSYLNNYVVENDLVKIRCYITLENKSNIKQTVKVVANFENEVNIGLLKKEEITGFFVETNSETITVPPFSSVEYLEIEFSGEFGGVSKMKCEL